MPNILDALVTLKNTSSFLIADSDRGNRIQRIGAGLEGYVRDLFAGTLYQAMPAEERLSKYEAAFSYFGTANQPPDAILRDGDAIEVKKVDGLNASIQLNSSPPKSTLLASDSRINKTCKSLAEAEGWLEKDLFYVVGSLSENKLARLWFIYGDCYAASHETYENIYQRAKTAVANGFEEVELSDTNEIAGIPNVDPLKITHLRVRGMWIIKNPSVVFEEYITAKSTGFKAYCIMRADKYDSFPESSRKAFEAALDGKMDISDIKIPNPDNPAEILNAKLIRYEI